MKSAVLSQEGQKAEQEVQLLPPKRAKKDFFSFMPPSTPERIRHKSGASDIDAYLSEPCIDMNDSVLEFWKDNSFRFPSLASVAIRYLAIPATSAPVERMFIITGKIYRPDRCSLKDETFETLMTIELTNIRYVIMSLFV